MRSAEIQCCTFTQTFPLCNMVKTYSKCLPSSIPRICSVAIKWFNCSAEHREIQNLRRVIFLPSLYLTLPPSSPSLMHLSPHHSNPLLSFPAFVLILNKHSWHPVFPPLTTFIFFPPLCHSHFLGPRLHLLLRILMKTRSRDAPNKVLQCWLPQFKPPLICCLLFPHNTLARFLTASLNCYTICIHSTSLKCNPICSFPLSLELSLHTTHPQLSDYDSASCFTRAMIIIHTLSHRKKILPSST